MNDYNFYINKEDKNNFLDEIKRIKNLNTYELYLSVMVNVVDIAEKNLNKLWEDFSIEDIKYTLIELESKSHLTMLSYLSVIKNYITYTTKTTNISKDGIIYTMSLDKHSIKKFLNKIGEEMKFLTKKEIDDILDNDLIDTCVKSIIFLLYNGVRGKNFEDLLNLTKSDVNRMITNKYICHSDVYIEPKYTKMLLSSLGRDNIIKYNLNCEQIRTYNLHESDYFINKTNAGFNMSNIDCSEKPTLGTVRKRIDLIKPIIGNPYITALSISNSGLVWRMLELNDFKMMSHTDYKAYRDIFNVNIGYETYKNISNILLKKIG